MCRTENSECLFSRMKTILRLSFPLVAAEIAISFNGFTDGLFLSRFSETALRASLPANMIAACVLAPITAALSYSGTLVAQACGGRLPHKLSRSSRKRSG